MSLNSYLSSHLRAQTGSSCTQASYPPVRRFLPGHSGPRGNPLQGICPPSPASIARISRCSAPWRRAYRSFAVSSYRSIPFAIPNWWCAPRSPWESSPSKKCSRSAHSSLGACACFGWWAAHCQWSWSRGSWGILTPAILPPPFSKRSVIYSITMMEVYI